MKLIKLFGKKGKETDVLFEKFKTLVEKEGLTIDKIDEEGLIHILQDEWTLRVSLDNLRKIYQRDKDDDAIKDFVQTLTVPMGNRPSWEEAKKDVYFSLFPGDYDFAAYPNKAVTKEFNQVYVYCANDLLSWVSHDDISTWNISAQELHAQAGENTAAALDEATLCIEWIKDRKLGYLEVERESTKGALLLSSRLKEKVSGEFGWPVYAVVPVRDFCYIFAEADFSFFSERLGPTVLEEYKQSGYPVTTEILRFDDEGIKAVGKYAQNEKDD